MHSVQPAMESSVLQCVALCCSTLQCVAVSVERSVLQRVAACCIVLHCVAVSDGMKHHRGRSVSACSTRTKSRLKIWIKCTPEV